MNNPPATEPAAKDNRHRTAPRARDGEGGAPLAPLRERTECPVVDLGEQRRRAESRDRWRNQRIAAGLLPGERVRDCQRSLTRMGVDVVSDPDKGRTEYAGVLTCDSRWHCPLCAAKLTERDRVELQHGMVLHKRSGGVTCLLTFTFPHDVTMPLRESLTKMQAAQKWMKAQRAYKTAMKAAGALGAVKATEVTYGGNGWHPHVHMLVFAREGAEAHLEEIRAVWAAAVERVGLGRVNEHGFDCRGGDFAADYVAKFGKEPSDLTRTSAGAWWTAAHEMTKGHTKQTQRLKGATPFTLLRWYRDGDAQSGALFVEYAKAFKGKPQLYWSPRLRKKLDLLELQNPKKLSEKIKRFHLSPDDWRAVLRHDARWEILYVVERYGAEEAAALVTRLRERAVGRWSESFKYETGLPAPEVHIRRWAA